MPSPHGPATPADQATNGPTTPTPCGEACECVTNPAAPSIVPLAHLRVGQTAVICQKNLASDEQEVLRAMGLRRDARIRVCRSGEPCIVAVQTGGAEACRIGLARPLAAKVLVQQVGS